MLDQIKKTTPSSQFQSSKRSNALRHPVSSDLPSCVPKNNPKDRKRILKAFNKVTKKIDGNLAVMQKLFDKNVLEKSPELLKMLMQPLK